ncbi:mitochondrial carrier domain-containing protein [Cladochytrium replicatum]|nr:mitochondrial carrier domain-containing protein [Cladochytrium replicatum]
MAAVVTHPLDTVKVRLQTQAKGTGLVTTISNMAFKEGFGSFYRGLTASLLRQATYSTARFAVYEKAKEELSKRSASQSSTVNNLLAGLIGGVVGGIAGSPADRANVLAQSKAPQASGNVFVTLYRVMIEDGVLAVFQGIGPNIVRGMLMTATQIGSYDIIKQYMLDSGYFKDGLGTHFLGSSAAGLIATTVTNPVDVVKTRLMSSKPGTYTGSFDCMYKLMRAEGPAAFMKGWIPSFTRLGPHTVLTLVIYDELKELYIHSKKSA